MEESRHLPIPAGVPSVCSVSRILTIRAGGNTIPAMLIDIHIHTAKERHPKLGRSNGTHYPTPERAIQMMDEAGIDRAVVLSTVSPEWRYTLVTTEETLEICAAYRVGIKDTSPPRRPHFKSQFTYPSRRKNRMRSLRSDPHE